MMVSIRWRNQEEFHVCKLYWFFQPSNSDSLLFLLYFSYSLGPVKNVHVIHYFVRAILDQMNVFFSWEVWFNYFLQILVCSYHSCLLLSSSLSNMHTQLFTDHMPSLIFFYHYGPSKFSTEVLFSGKNAIWENGNIYWKVLVPLKQTGAALVVLLAWTWTPAKKPSDGICRWNVMIEWAVYLLCSQEEISLFSEIHYWAGALKFNKQCTFLYFNLHEVIVMWNFGLKTTRSFKVLVT